MAIVLWLVLLEGLYLRALRVLKRRGVTVPRFQIAMWHTAMALWIIGLLSPVDWYGDDLLSAHMLQHLLIADLAAPIMLVGLRNPVLMFFLPRSALVPLARTRWLRTASGSSAGRWSRSRSTCSCSTAGTGRSCSTRP